jgi:hypothetical protein
VLVYGAFLALLSVYLVEFANIPFPPINQNQSDDETSAVPARAVAPSATPNPLLFQLPPDILIGTSFAAVNVPLIIFILINFAKQVASLLLIESFAFFVDPENWIGRPFHYMFIIRCPHKQHSFETRF